MAFSTKRVSTALVLCVLLCLVVISDEGSLFSFVSAESKTVSRRRRSERDVSGASPTVGSSILQRRHHERLQAAESVKQPTQEGSDDDNDDEFSFERFRATFPPHDKKSTLSETPEELARQRSNFNSNMNAMRETQSRHPLATFEWQPWFAELHPEEARRRFLAGDAFFSEAIERREELRRAEQQQSGDAEGSVEWTSSMFWPPVGSGSMTPSLDAPSKKDWRAEGLVTPVKDQGKCGSCWAFSTIGNLEGVWAKAGNPLTAFSEQMLVSCDDSDHACGGGLMEYAFGWMQKNTNRYVATEASYPYVSGDKEVPGCLLSTKPVEWGGYFSSVVFVNDNEDLIETYLAQNGPLAIAVDASDFITYSSGVLTNATAVRLNHGVLLVGYNNNHNPPYWIIKNSWGTRWGESGYIRIEKNRNACLVTEYVISAILNGDAPPPSPPPPPPPPPPSGSVVLTHMSCTGYFCGGTCVEERWETSACLPAPFGEAGSMIVQCGATDMIRRRYPGSTTCEGEVVYDTASLDTCYPHLSGSDKYVCGRN